VRDSRPRPFPRAVRPSTEPFVPGSGAFSGLGGTPVSDRASADRGDRPAAAPARPSVARAAAARPPTGRPTTARPPVAPPAAAGRPSAWPRPSAGRTSAGRPSATCSPSARTDGPLRRRPRPPRRLLPPLAPAAPVPPAPEGGGPSSRPSPGFARGCSSAAPEGGAPAPFSTPPPRGDGTEAGAGPDGVPGRAVGGGAGRVSPMRGLELGLGLGASGRGRTGPAWSSEDGGATAEAGWSGDEVRGPRSAGAGPLAMESDIGEIPSRGHAWSARRAHPAGGGRDAWEGGGAPDRGALVMDEHSVPTVPVA